MVKGKDEEGSRVGFAVSAKVGEDLVLRSAIESAIDQSDRRIDYLQQQIDLLVRQVEKLRSHRSDESDSRADQFRVETDAPIMLDETEADLRLAARTEHFAEEGLLTSDEMAKLLGFKRRQSVHDWYEKGKIIGWSGAKRGLYFPAAQLDENNRPIDGLVEIIKNFADGLAAWDWLNTRSAALGYRFPLSVLHKGDKDSVIAAAEGYQQGDFG